MGAPQTYSPHLSSKSVLSTQGLLNTSFKLHSASHLSTFYLRKTIFQVRIYGLGNQRKVARLGSRTRLSQTTALLLLFLSLKKLFSAFEGLIIRYAIFSAVIYFLMFYPKW